MAECNRCGACCIYFGIKDSSSLDIRQVIFKEAYTVCPHLSFEGDRAKCRIYNNGRPEICKVSSCEFIQNEKIRAGLKRTKTKMGEIREEVDRVRRQFPNCPVNVEDIIFE